MIEKSKYQSMFYFLCTCYFNAKRALDARKNNETIKMILKDIPYVITQDLFDTCL